MLNFLRQHGHDKEARHVQIVLNWHKASDGRGMDEPTRSMYNKAMLDWLLEDWMPWFHYDRDYRSMDVDRPIKGIRGLTREVVVALVANIESQEHRRLYSPAPEHPHASSIDDLEGFFSIVHEMLGPSFDLNTFFDQYPKILDDFNQRLDPNTPFFYYTSKNERYALGPLKSFNEPSGHTERLDKVIISRRADPGVFVSN